MTRSQLFTLSSEACEKKHLLARALSLEQSLGAILCHNAFLFSVIALCRLQLPPRVAHWHYLRNINNEVSYELREIANGI